MSSLTISGLGKTLVTRLEARDIDEGVSVNQLVKTLLERSLGVKSSNNRQQLTTSLLETTRPAPRRVKNAQDLQHASGHAVGNDVGDLDHHQLPRS